MTDEKKKDANFQEYPKDLYNKDGGAMQVASAEEEKKAGALGFFEKRPSPESHAHPEPTAEPPKAPTPKK